MQKTISISEREYAKLKKKEALADDILLRLEATLRDVEAGRVRRVR